MTPKPENQRRPEAAKVSWRGVQTRKHALVINFRLRWGVGAGAFHNFQPAPEAAVTSRVEKGVRGQDGPAQDDETTFLIKIRAVDYKHCDDLALPRFYYLDLQFCFRNEVYYY